MTPSTKNVLKGALLLAGWDKVLVIPVNPANKRPYLQGWQRRGSRDIKQIKDWWGQWPEATIGVLTGEESGVWALDIDDKYEGSKSLAGLELSYGRLPDTARHTTPGGRRLFFKWPNGVTLKNRSSDIAPGLDVRGGTACGKAKGQAIVPPSVRADGGRYIWEGSWTGLSGCAEAPLWLLFLAIFNKRERARLAACGINGPEGFGDLPIEQWAAAAREKIRPKRETVDLVHDLEPHHVDTLTRYLQKSIRTECEELRNAPRGVQDITLNNVGLKVHSLLKGADELGLDTAELEEGAYQQYVEATLAMVSELGREPWEIEHAEDKWRRTEADAEPRDLTHVLQRDRNPSHGFEPVVPAGNSFSHRLVSRRADEITPEALVWLWPGRLPLGKCTLLAGHGGLGKTTVLMATAAIVSRGGEWPCGEGRAECGSVIIFSAEDDAADTLIPRLIAAGADLAKVHIVSAVKREGGEGRRSFNPQADLVALEQMIESIGDVRLVIFDPISSYFGRTDTYRNTEVRAVLEPVGEMAARHRVTIIGNTHLAKGATGRANHRVLDSVAITAHARAILIVTEDPENKARRFLLPSKANYGAPRPGLSFHIDAKTIDLEKNIVGSHVVWGAQPVTATADEVLAASDTKSKSKGPTALDEAKAWLRDFLAGGPKPSPEVLEAGQAHGHATITLRRASKALNVQHPKIDFDGGWAWELPPIQMPRG